MGIRTLLKYLLGNRQAIIDVAESRGKLGIGALFVLAAGFARHYDGAYLLAQPWYLLLPFAVSMVLALVLFTLVRLGLCSTDRYPGFWAGYRTFLGLFWMTAPVALLYAVPYEHFLSPVDSVKARLWTIGIVSAWRILLMTRVLSVVMGCSVVRTFFIVMALADGAALLVLCNAPLPVFSVMGGIHLTQSEDIILGTALLLMVAGFFSGLIWLIGAIVAIVTRKMTWQPEPPPARLLRPASGPLKALAVVSVLVWAAILPLTQPAQRLRVRAEKALVAGHITEAVAEMSAHAQSAYPPHWDPPPRPGYGEDVPPLLDVIRAAAQPEVQTWVRALYLKKFEQEYLEGGPPTAQWLREWPVAMELLQRFPEGRELLRQYQQYHPDTNLTIKSGPTTAPTSRPSEAGAP